MVTDAQVRRLREKRMTGKTLAAAAAAAGVSERTARRWQSGALPSTAKAPRTWRTREDPFGDVWETEVVPQLVADTEGRLQALTLFRWLCRRHPGRFPVGQLRTLQRRVREWRAQDGPDREVYFEQVAVPGREAAFDFTDASSLGVRHRDVADIGRPHLIRSLDGQAPQQVRIHRVSDPGLARARLRIQGAQAHLAHQALDSLAIHRVPLGLELVSKAATAVERTR